VTLRLKKVKTRAADASAELARQGVDPDDEVNLVINLDDGLPGRRESRARVIAAGLSDDEIDRLIDEEREAVQHLIK
jgi:hypothetical protein